MTNLGGDSTEAPQTEERSNRDNSSAGGPLASPSEDGSAGRDSCLSQGQRRCHMVATAPGTH